MKSIPFIDLHAQRVLLKDKIDQAVSKVLDHGIYVMGPEVKEFETKLSKFCGSKHVITCANGTDALSLALMAEGIGYQDIVFVPAFTFIATAEAVAQLGAIPYFVDIDENTFNMDPSSLEEGIKDAKRKGLNIKGVIAVDLFGLCADYEALQKICDEESLTLIADSAQSFGANSKGQKVGTLASFTTTSFFPAKPLGCYGDGGAVFVQNDETADILRSLRVHGKGVEKYDNVRIGLNSRLDTIQAAILLVKLDVFAEELQKRQEIATFYSQRLSGYFECPFIPSGFQSAWAQYTIKSKKRSEIMSFLAEYNIPTAIYYPIPLNKQKGYEHFPSLDDLSISEKLSKEVFSIPISPYLSAGNQNYIIDRLCEAYHHE